MMLNIKLVHKKYAFTLVELMVTLLIVGILIGVATVSYSTYSNRIRMAEAVNIVDALAKKEIAYYLSNKKFISFYTPVTDDGTNHYNSTTPYIPSNQATYIINSSNYPASDNAWNKFGNPLADGTAIKFIYAGGAGKTNSSGQSAGINGSAPPNPLFVHAPGGEFNTGFVSGQIQNRPLNMQSVWCQEQYPDGVNNYQVMPNKSWVILAAMANFNNSVGDVQGQSVYPSCSTLVKLLEIDSNGKVASGGLIVKNSGH